MSRSLLKSKINRAKVTEANLDYEGSLTIDRYLMDAADLLPYEEVHVFNITNGHRFLTYVIEGDMGSNTICVNGAAAHLAKKGDFLIIASFSSYDEDECKNHVPKLIYVNEFNELIEFEPDSVKLELTKG